MDKTYGLEGLAVGLGNRGGLVGGAASHLDHLGRPDRVDGHALLDKVKRAVGEVVRLRERESGLNGLRQVEERG